MPQAIQKVPTPSIVLVEQLCLLLWEANLYTCIYIIAEHGIHKDVNGHNYCLKVQYLPQGLSAPPRPIYIALCFVLDIMFGEENNDLCFLSAVWRLLKQTRRV